MIASQQSWYMRADADEVWAALKPYGWERKHGMFYKPSVLPNQIDLKISVQDGYITLPSVINRRDFVAVGQSLIAIGAILKESGEPE